MKINELLMNIKNKEFKLESGLQIKKYLPIEVKKTVAQAIIYDCTEEEFGVIKVDSVEQYMSYVRHMIISHTNLEYTDEDYDTLCSTEYGEITLLNAIMNCFGEDAKECTRVLNLMMDDHMQEMTIEFAIAKFLSGLNKSIDSLVKKFGDVDLQSVVPDSVDMNKLSTFLQDYMK